ncbi:hypothetical protein [Methylobacterium sp. CM6246]
MTDRSDYILISNDAVHHSDFKPGGSIDSIDGNEIKGWCVDPAAAERPVSLNVNIADFCIAEIITEVERADIARHFDSTAFCGFCFSFLQLDTERASSALEKFEIALSERPGETADIRVLVKDTDYELPRWNNAGSTFSNINLLSVLKSSSSNRLIETPSLPKRGGFMQRPSAKSDALGYTSEEITHLLQRIGQTNEYHYLSGIERYFEHGELEEPEIVEALSLAIGSTDVNLIVRFAKAAAESGKVDSIPINLLLQVSKLLSKNRGIRDIERMSPDVIIGSINVYKDITRRQQFLIEALLSRLSKA